jgi:protein CMS1
MLNPLLGKYILDTSSWTRDRRLSELPVYLENFSKDELSVAPKEPGSPHTLVVTAAGLRSADVFRTLQKYRTKDAMVAKLFAKHIKLKEAVESCKRMRMNFGVGTPQRIYDLLESGALSTTKLKRIVIDASHIDQKKRGVLDMKETLMPLLRLLNRKELQERYSNSKNATHIIFF